MLLNTEKYTGNPMVKWCGGLIVCFKICMFLRVASVATIARTVISKILALRSTMSLC